MKNLLPKADKSKPVWFMIKGVEKPFATSMGIEHYLIDNHLQSAPIMAVQKINNEWVEVQHKFTGKVYVVSSFLN